MTQLLKKNIYSFIYLFTTIYLCLDVYNSDSSTLKYFSISSRDVVIVSIIVLAILRMYFSQKLQLFLSKCNAFFLFPLALFVCIAFTIYDYFTPANAAYMLAPIQYTQLCVISIFSLMVILLQQSNDWFEKYYQYVIFVSSFVVFGYAYLSSLFPRDIFAVFSKEDHLIENVQFYVLLIASYFSAQVARILIHKQRIYGVIFIVAAIVLFFIAGDEISWGQRIFNITTPDVIAQNNHQEEITIHNMSSVVGYVGIGYISVGFYGAFAWLMQFVFPILRKIPFSYFIPAWSSMGYYFFCFLYNYYSIGVTANAYAIWAEFAELMLYAGVMCTFIVVYVKLKLHK